MRGPAINHEPEAKPLRFGETKQKIFEHIPGLFTAKLILI